MSGIVRPIRALKPCKCGCTDINVEQQFDVLTRTYFCLVGCMDINCEEHIIAESKISYIEAREIATNEWNRRATNETD